VTLNGPHPNNRTVVGKLDLVSNVVPLWVKGSKKYLLKVSLVTLGSIDSKPLVSKAAVGTDRCPTIMPKQSLKIPGQTVVEPLAPSLVRDVSPIGFQFLLSLTPTVLGLYLFDVAGSRFWGTPEIEEIVDRLVLDRQGLLGRTG
jgi:hypothetical protein